MSHGCNSTLTNATGTGRATTRARERKVVTAQHRTREKEERRRKNTHATRAKKPQNTQHRTKEPTQTRVPPGKGGALKKKDALETGGVNRKTTRLPHSLK